MVPNVPLVVFQGTTILVIGPVAAKDSVSVFLAGQGTIVTVVRINHANLF